MDRRVRYTKMVLKQSLIELMTEKPLNKISVTDVCDRADVNRGTFYAHYRDVYNLLESIQDELVEQIKSAIPNRLTRSSTRDMLISFLKSVKSNGEFCKVLFSSNGDKRFLFKLMNIAREDAFAQWKEASVDISEEQMEQLYMFVATGAAAIIEQWIVSDSDTSPEELASFLEQASQRGLRSFFTRS